MFWLGEGHKSLLYEPGSLCVICHMPSIKNRCTKKKVHIDVTTKCPGRGNVTGLENINWLDQLRRALRVEDDFPGAIRCLCKCSHQPGKLYSG